MTGTRRRAEVRKERQGKGEREEERGEIVRREVRPEVRTTLERFRGRALPYRFIENFGRGVLEAMLAALGVRVAYADSPEIPAIEIQLPESARASWQAIQELIPTTSAGSAYAIVDHRLSLGEVEDYLLPVTLAASDRNLIYTVWVSGAGKDDVARLRSKVREYALKYFGFDPKNFKMEVAPVSVIGTLAAYVRKAEGPVGFVSPEAPESNSIRGVKMARGSHDPNPQALTAALLREKVQNSSREELDPKVYSPEDFDRWSELLDNYAAVLRQILAAA